jgi:hypothetical protein
MTDPWSYIGPALILAFLFYCLSKAVIGNYFKAKEGFVNKLVDKLKGASNGKRE